MKAFRLLRRNFEHGVHPAHHKQQTADLPIQRVPFGKDYVMPLGQHIGVPAKAIVTAGERVQRGQLIDHALPLGWSRGAAIERDPELLDPVLVVVDVLDHGCSRRSRSSGDRLCAERTSESVRPT